MAPSVIGVMISVGGFSALLGSLCARPLAKAIGYGPAVIAGFACSLFYLVINVVVMGLMRVVEGRTRVPGYIGSQ